MTEPDDGQRQPLIGDEHGDDATDRNETRRRADARSPVLFIWILTLAAGISGLLFGYDTGVISSTLVSIGDDLSGRPLTRLDKSLITSCTSLFAFIADPLTGAISDSLGRKSVILIADILFIAGALWQAVTTSVWGMILGRSVVGFAIGSASFVTPLYISELAPAQHRGRLVVISVLMITLGQVIAYVIGWSFSEAPRGWRWMVGLGAAPAIAQLALFAFMPETPRWLVMQERIEKARQVLQKAYGSTTDEIVETTLRRIESELNEESRLEGVDPHHATPGMKSEIFKTKARFSELVRVPSNRRALIIACMLQGLQQLCGFNVLMYFSATIFALVGFQSPTLTALCVAMTNFLFTVVAFYAIDTVGRRRILLYSIPVMVVGLILCSVAFNFIDIHAVQGADTGKGGPWPILVVVAMVIYVAGYAIGLGNVPWQQSELFPLTVRSLGGALATSTNWLCNTIVGFTFLPLLWLLTGPGTFALYAAICVAGWIAVWLIYPETAGLSLEEVGTLLKGGWLVRGQHRARGLLGSS
ncbi:putative transporter protein [Eremomyces bilateralis CBS 781.70]|uniref:Transporter protein n=1 Tax=Eremomyces bilateralis CBS 781.70 TaxID=1392243 RepID=A0A6G1FWJ4_9PEZI|nr:putative transporter protein [Eremomyces bilateralis CBS 781.70]KAF1810207.1 putative transporter protein [Eremomyces bilateralis CBS 781.70]